MEVIWFKYGKIIDGLFILLISPMAPWFDSKLLRTCIRNAIMTNGVLTKSDTFNIANKKMIEMGLHICNVKHYSYQWTMSSHFRGDSPTWPFWGPMVSDHRSVTNFFLSLTPQIRVVTTCQYIHTMNHFGWGWT